MSSIFSTLTIIYKTLIKENKDDLHETNKKKIFSDKFQRKI